VTVLLPIIPSDLAASFLGDFRCTLEQGDLGVGNTGRAKAAS
jgi:hypothetical protein